MSVLSVLATALGGVALVGVVARIMFPWLKYDWMSVKVMGKILLAVKSYVKNNQMIVDIFEMRAKENPSKTFLIFQDNNYSYEFMEKKMNQVARAGLELGLKAGDVVAVLMENEPAFIWTFYGVHHCLYKQC